LDGKVLQSGRDEVEAEGGRVRHAR
jgi:hypothetical protein